jgi:hypothetical protein
MVEDKDNRSKELSDSEVQNATRRDVGPAEKARRKNSQLRDARTNLGVGKPSNIVVD